MFEIKKGKLKKAQKVVLYGPEGIGKSTFGSKFPSPIFIDTEGSTTHLDVARLEKPKSWTELLKMIEFVKGSDKGFKTLVIDTADWAEQLAIDHICKNRGMSGLEDFGYGKGYTYLAEEFSKMLGLLDEVIESGLNVLVLAHAQMRKFEQPDEMGSYDRWELKLQRKTSPLLKEWADAVLFANYKTIVIEDSKTKSKKATGGKRVMYTTHHPAWDAKNRWGLPEELELSVKDVLPHLLVEGKEDKEVKEESKKETSKEEVKKDDEEFPFEYEIKHKKLSELMNGNKVKPEELEHAVIKQGFFPEGTVVDNYPNDFIEQVIIANWDEVYKSILNNRRNK